MLVRLRYTPNAISPYAVLTKSRDQSGWIVLKSFADETNAISFAKCKSREPDLPYIKSFENGEEISKNESTEL